MLDPTSTIVGAAFATLAWTALSMLLASRKDRKAREKLRQFAEMQRCIFDVQDAVADVTMDPPINPVHRQTAIRDLDDLRRDRDRAAAAYLEG